jgi:hypothetical protein
MWNLPPDALTAASLASIAEGRMSGIPIHHATGRVVAREYQGDDDFQRVRDLLIQTCAITPIEFNWEI